MNGYHEYSALNTSVLICTVLLHLHIRSLMPLQLSPCCPPDSIPQAAALHRAPLVLHLQLHPPSFVDSSSCCLVFHHLARISCFQTVVSWVRGIEFQSHLRLQEQQHLNPLPDTSQLLYQCHKVFLILQDSYSVKQERKRMQPSTILFLLELVIYTNGLYFVFERARNASPHTAHSSVDKQ